MVQTFQFQNHLIVYQDIDPITTVQLHVFIDNRDRYLSSKGNSSNMELMAEAFLVSRFQEAGSQRTVNLDGGTDNLPG